MTSVKTINAQHFKNLGVAIQTTKGRLSPPKEIKKIV
jgi:hypothetical protein